MMLPAAALPEFEFSWLPVGFDQWVDKIQHMIAFFVLTVLAARSLGAIKSIQRPVLTAAVLTLGYSFFLEILQAPLPWRYFDLRDMVADTVGVLLAYPVASWVVSKMPARAIAGADVR